MKKAIALVTYCRDQYFDLVLSSLLNQKIFDNAVTDEYDIYIFQDGLWDGEPETEKSGHATLSSILKNLPRTFEVHIQTKNLGVALHLDFVEKLLFVEKKYDFVYFVEDDLLLVPSHMQAVNLLVDKFYRDARIGMISANPGNMHSSLEDQEKNKNSYKSMGHSWAFGVFRNFYIKRQPFVEIYLKILGDVPYRNRPIPIIFSWLQKMGFANLASSQDYIKMISTLMLGGVRLATYQNYGLPIGRKGLHFTAESFKKFKLDRSIVFNGPLFEVPALDDSVYRKLLDEQLTPRLSKNDIGMPYVGSKEAKLWQQRFLNSYDFSTKDNRMPQQIKSNNPVISDKPWMPDVTVDRLRELLKTAKCYLEYGGGGSTIMAASMNVPQVITTESDINWLSALRDKLQSIESSIHAELIHADIGPTKALGHPVTDAGWKGYYRYPLTAWRYCLSHNLAPDVVLIDGRFRVACFLISLVHAKVGTRIIFDDYFDRPQYHSVEQFIQPVARHDRAAEFVIASQPAVQDVWFEVLKFIGEPA